MGNILKCFIGCFDEEDELDGGSGHGHFPNSYPPAARLHYQPLHLADLQLPLSPPPPQPSQQQQPARRPVTPSLGYHHGVPRPSLEITAPGHGFLNLKFTSTVYEGPKHHITSSRKTDLNRCIDEKDHGSSKPSLWSPRPPCGVAALVHDLLDFMITTKVPEGLALHVTSPMKAQVTWYRKISAAYKDTKSPLNESADATVLVATALRGIKRTNLEGVLTFYGFPIPTISKEASEKHPSSIPNGVLFVLKTLPVNAKCIVDGDGFTAYVDTLNPIELREDCNSSCQAPNSKKQKLWEKRATDLQMSLENTGQKYVN